MGRGWEVRQGAPRVLPAPSCAGDICLLLAQAWLPSSAASLLRASVSLPGK